MSVLIKCNLATMQFSIEILTLHKREHLGPVISVVYDQRQPQTSADQKQKSILSGDL